jgi:DNA-binding NtrC family response regulator
VPRILVVDDDPRIAEFLADALGLEGYELDVAADGRTALQHVDTERYDLVLSDVKMPGGLTGPDLYETLRQRDPDLARRFVLMTGDAVDPRIRAFLDRTGVPSLAKPFDLERMLQVVRRLAG